MNPGCRVMGLFLVLLALFQALPVAVDAWQAQQWPDPEAGIVLASGAGALGVRLGMDIVQDGELLERLEGRGVGRVDREGRAQGRPCLGRSAESGERLAEGRIRQEPY